MVTRLTYNCAHLRLTKESQIDEIGEKGGKYLEREKNYLLQRIGKREKEKKNARPSIYCA